MAGLETHNIDENYINNNLLKNDSLFNNIHVIEQNFDILPNEKNHYGASIAYQDLSELREDFLNELYDSIVSWVYNSEKYNELKQISMQKGKTDSAASSEIRRKAVSKFRGTNDSEKLLAQGQFGELLLFHFIQRLQKAVPLLRKMKITTSSEHERFGADAIHFKYKDGKPIIILGEAKTYTSKYRFNSAFEDALKSILNTHKNHRNEMHLYVHEDFLDKEMDKIAECYLNNTLNGVEVHLVSIIVYNETNKLNCTSEADIKKQIEDIISNRYCEFDNKKIDIENNAILKRITYIVFPIWKLEELVQNFQKSL